MRRYSAIFFIVLFIISCGKRPASIPFKVSLKPVALFHMGDNPRWAQPGWDDSGWEKISLKMDWEKQGHPGYDGFAWYRISFDLPLRPAANKLLNDKIKIFLGRIDDYDQIFLNGRLIGENNKRTRQAGPDALFTTDGVKYDIPRTYMLDGADSVWNWGSKNILAVRVFDSGGPGGIYDNVKRAVVPAGLGDFVHIDFHSNAFRIKNRHTFIKTLALVNDANRAFELHLTIDIKNSVNKQRVFHIDEMKSFAPNSHQNLNISFVDTANVPHQAIYRLTLDKVHSITAVETLPFILTPPEKKIPQINTPAVYGAGAGHPFLYRVPVSGQKPVHLSVKNLPEGLTLENGILHGRIENKGDYPLILIAQNNLGADTARLVVRIGRGLALTPPLGWNSWNCWGTSVDAKKVRDAAGNMIASGLADHGWQYINIDDGWEAERSPAGQIKTNKKFPDMKTLVGSIHAMGLKVGIYSSPGPETCAGFTGSYKHEFLDARTYAQWGIDYLKYDWCSYRRIAPHPGPDDLEKPYALMARALAAQNRDIIYSLCQYGMGGVWRWARKNGGNLARTTGDITDTWQSMSKIGFGQDSIAAYAGPGYWNDPDMLVVGQVGWGAHLHPTRLTPDEQYAHVSLWSLLAAPLIIGADLSTMDNFTLALLNNDEVLAIDQDEAGQQARPVFREDSLEVWARPLANGDWAAGLFNRSSQRTVVSLRRDDLGIEGRYFIRDVWRQKDVARFRDSFDVPVRPHGVELFRLRKIVFHRK